MWTHNSFFFFLNLCEHIIFSVHQRMYLWWSLCTLYLHACQMRVTVDDSSLCCCTYVFWALISSLVCWFRTRALGLVLFQIYVNTCQTPHLKMGPNCFTMAAVALCSAKNCSSKRKGKQNKKHTTAYVFHLALDKLLSVALKNCPAC